MRLLMLQTELVISRAWTSSLQSTPKRRWCAKVRAELQRVVGQRAPGRPTAPFARVANAPDPAMASTQDPAAAEAATEPAADKAAPAADSAAGENSNPKSATAPRLWDPEHVLDLVQLNRHELAKKGAAAAPPPLKSFTYTPGSVFDAQAVLKQDVPLCTVVVLAEHLAASNPAFKQSRLWGTDLYTADSDVVCALAHLGYIEISTDVPAKVTELLVTLRITHPATTYAPSTRCGLRSRRRSGDAQGPLPYSYLVESCVLKLDGDLKDEELYPTSHIYQQPLRVGRPRQQGSARYCLPGLTVVFDLAMDPCLKYSLPMVIDTYEAAPEEEEEEDETKSKSKASSKAKSSKPKAAKKVSSADEGEGSKGTKEGGDASGAAGARAASPADSGDSPAEDKGDVTGDGTAVGDGNDADADAPVDSDAGGGAAPAATADVEELAKPAARIVIETSRMTSARLQKECIYMETGFERYELVQEDAVDKKRLTYRLSRVLQPQLLDQTALCAQTRPLAANLVEVVHENLNWRQVKWSPTGVNILGLRLQLTCLRFIPRTSDAVSPAGAGGVVHSFTSREARARAAKQKRMGTATVGPVAEAENAQPDDDAMGDKLDDGEEKSRLAKGKSGKSKSKGKLKDKATNDDGGDEEGDGETASMAVESEAAPDEAAAPAQRSSRRSKGKVQEPMQEPEQAEKRGSARTAGKRTRGGASALPADDEEDKKANAAQAKGLKRPKRGR